MEVRWPNLSRLRLLLLSFDIREIVAGVRASAASVIRLAPGIQTTVVPEVCQWLRLIFGYPTGACSTPLQGTKDKKLC